MAIPPPPPGPPGPPPPPIGNLNLGAPAFGKSSGGSGDTRSALLLSIQKGAKLKKTTTIDKSGPIVSGKISNANTNTNTNSNNNNTRTNSNAPSRPPPPNSENAIVNGKPKLSGIFEGLSEMPKLKPVGNRSLGMTSPSSESPPSAGGSPQNTSTSNSNDSAIDFSKELSQRLMMKKQMPQQQGSNTNANANANTNTNTSSEMNTRNRGPPPQPPSKMVTDNNSGPTPVKSNLLNKQSNSGSSIAVSSNGVTILPNKSTLYGNNVNTSSAVTTKAPTNNVVPNHGKPYCAPKPPGLKNGLSPLSNISSANNNGNNGRSNVARSQSVRTPRSPISIAPGPTQHFGTLRGAPAMFQPQDSINSVSIRPSQPIHRPTEAPPKPPVEVKSVSVKEQAQRIVLSDKRAPTHCKSPPPPPIREKSISNSNLPSLPLSTPPTAISQNLSSNCLATNFGGSASNVSTLMTNNITDNIGSASNLSLTKDRSPHVSTSNFAPPLPPHRNPAPPPPIRHQPAIPPNNDNSGAPAVPPRVSSIRNSNGAQMAIVQQQTTVTTGTTNSTRTVTRFVMDLDARFGAAFHNVTEFPAPSPFTRLEKSYPSRNIKATTEIRKAKAPSPPSMKTTANTAATTNEKFFLQLTQDDKLYTDESSYC